MKKYLVLILAMALLLTGCEKEEVILEDIESNVPEGIILTKDELEFGEKLNKVDESLSVSVNEAAIDNTESLDSEVASALETSINPYDAYDAYMAFAENKSLEEVKEDRQIDGLKIAISTTKVTPDMAITNFDVYTQIALLYFVHIDGHARDVFDLCNNEEEVKNYLISQDGLGKLKFSTIINEHKFVR